MADRSIRILTTGDIIGTGIAKIAARTVQFEGADTDKVTVAVDYTRWLDGETLSSITMTASGMTAASSVVTPVATLTLSAFAGEANVEVLALSSGARKHTFWINVQETDRTGAMPAPGSDYQRSFP